jgi:pyruvate-formate lyase-activating enzyme
MSTLQTISTTPGQDLSFLWLEITAKCNLECIHCYADSGPRQSLLGQISTEEWLNIIRDSVRLGCRQVQFIGGEPTLHPDLARMISLASDEGYTFIEVFTNATNISDRLLRTFVKCHVHVATSFYSSDPDIHESITKRRGSFGRTVETLKRMLAAGLPIRVGIIETSGNIGHTEKARLFLESLGIAEISVDSQRGVGRGASDLIVDPMSELCGECWKGKLCVTSSGATYPCVFSRFADLGSAKSGIKKILTSEHLTTFRLGQKQYQYELEARKNDSRGVGSEIKTKCNPQCSPCGPDAFPLDECAPKRAYLPRQNSDLIARLSSAEEGTAQTDILAALAPCPPATCAPCGPDSFRKCAPRVQEERDYSS